MKTMKKLTAVLLLLCLTLPMAACSGTGQPAATAAPTPAPAPPDSSLTPVDEVPASASSLNFNLAELDFSLPVNVMVLNGPTGFGMAKLIANTAENYALLNYNFTVESDASNITAALVSGDADLAALPTNAAAALYNRTEGGVAVVAEIVRGNLFLLQNPAKESIRSFADLRGKTVYAPAQNPSFIMNWLCAANGLKVGEDVVIDNSYAQPADLRTALAAGEVDLAVLPEPMVTIAMSANEALEIALDLDAEWNSAGGDGIVLGCIVGRREWIDAHPHELAAFLYEYNESVQFALQAPDAAGQAIQETGVFNNAAVAAKALPRCSLCYVTDEPMRVEVGAFLEKLFEVAPQSIGGALPEDGFYYFINP
ncbi:MAG: ABC transporter substrate-binding protein [Oscillospiraceae bacterium]|nr:ABC transporter substrate-binding protein [Oscillospiraceae bacterium]